MKFGPSNCSVVAWTDTERDRPTDRQTHARITWINYKIRRKCKHPPSPTIRFTCWRLHI